MMSYRVIVATARLGLLCFYRNVEVVGIERLPHRRGLLLTSNHTNAFVDSLLVMHALSPRRVRITAKAALLKTPLLGSLLRGAGAITFHRREDGTAQRSNGEAIDAVVAALTREEIVLLFPEGFSHSDGALRPFKSGAARMAISAAATSSVAVVPMSITYLDKGRFRSDVLLEFGPALERDTIRSHTPPALTGIIRQHVENLSITVPPSEMRELAWVADLIRYSLRSPERIGTRESVYDRVVTMREIAALRAHADNPAVRELEIAAHLLYQRAGQYGVRPHELWLPLSPWRATVFVLREGEVLIAGLPFALWGAIHALPSYLLIKTAVRCTAKDEDHLATHAIFLGIPLCTSVALVQTAIVGTVAGYEVALLYMLTLPFFVYVALLYADRLKDSLLRARSFLGLVRSRNGRDILRAEVTEFRNRVEGIREEIKSGLHQEIR